MRAVGTQLPSSLNIRTPASTISPSSAIDSPARPLVIAPTGNTSASPAAAALSRISATMPAWSVTGSVFAIDETAVNPPDRGGPRAARDRLLVLEARFAQVRVQVDEPGRERPAPRTSSTSAPCGSRPGPTDRSAPRRPARRRPRRGPSRIDHPSRRGTARAQARATSRSSLASALRCGPRRRAAGTAATSAPRCRSSPAPRSPHCGRSATSESISTPRFMGPGCMISEPSGSTPTRERR